MDYDFLQAVLGQHAPQLPQGPAGRAAQPQPAPPPLLQTNAIENMPGMAPGVAPRTLGGGYPGQAAPPANFSQQPPQNFPPAYAGPAPGTFAYSRNLAFDQAGSDFNQGNYGAAAGSALRGVGAAIPAAVAAAYHSAVAPHAPTPAASSPLAHGAQEFVRGLTGAPQASPMLPEFNQQVQQLQPPRPTAFSQQPGTVGDALAISAQSFRPPTVDSPFAAPPTMPSSGPTNSDVVGASLAAHGAVPEGGYSGPRPWMGLHNPDGSLDYSNGGNAQRDAVAEMRGGLPGGPTTNAWYDHVNQLLAGSGPAAGHEILAAAKAGTPFAQIAAGIPQLRQTEADSHRGAPGQRQSPYDGQWYTPADVQSIGPQGVTMWPHGQSGGAQRGGPVQGAIAAQQPMSRSEAALQSLPPELAGLLRAGHFSRDQVAHMVGSFAPQMTQAANPVTQMKQAWAEHQTGLAQLKELGVAIDPKSGVVNIPPEMLKQYSPEQIAEVIAQTKKHYYGANAISGIINQLNALPGIGSGP